MGRLERFAVQLITNQKKGDVCWVAARDEHKLESFHCKSWAGKPRFAQRHAGRIHTLTIS